MGQFMSTQICQREKPESQLLRSTLWIKSRFSESHTLLLVIQFRKHLSSCFYVKIPGLQGCITAAVLLIFSLSHVLGFHRSLCFTSMQDAGCPVVGVAFFVPQKLRYPLDLIYPSPGDAGSWQMFQFPVTKDVRIMMMRWVGCRSNICHHKGTWKSSSLKVPCLGGDNVIGWCISFNLGSRSKPTHLTPASAG